MDSPDDARPAERAHARSNKPRTHSSDSGVFLNMDEPPRATEPEQTRGVNRDVHVLRPAAVVSPPPLPPKQRRRPPTLYQPSDQDSDNPPANSLTCPAAGGDKDSQRSGPVTESAPQPTGQLKPPAKPPRPNRPKSSEVGEQQRGRKTEEGRREQGDERSERREEPNEIKEEPRREDGLREVKPSRQILVIFRDVEEQGDDEGHRTTAENVQNVTENSSLVRRDENATTTIRTPEGSPTAHTQTPAKPAAPTEAPLFFGATKAARVEGKEARKQEEPQRRREDTLDKRGDECEAAVDEDAPKETEDGGKPDHNLHVQFQLPGPQPPRRENPVPLPRGDPRPISHAETDSSENRRERPETVQTHQKPRARTKVKKLAKKVMLKIREGREEKRRMKGGETRERELTKDEEMKEERRWEEGGEDTPAVTREGVNRRYSTPANPFGSFRVYGPVMLVTELLSGDEWFPFLHSCDSPADGTQTEDRVQHRASLQFRPSTDPDVGPHVSPADPPYESIDLLSVSAAEQLDSAQSGFYDPVECVRPARTHSQLPEVKSQAVLDTSVQKYLIKLRKRSKHKVRKKQRDRSHGTVSDSVSPTSSQTFSASVFYNVPAAAAETQPQTPAVTSEGHSPRITTRIKAALKEKTAQPRVDRGK